jgi:hypothetical protein
MGTGEKSLNISDRINFRRNVSQIITSSPYVKLEDGLYTLAATVRNSTGFDKLEMYAISHGITRAVSFAEENASWKAIRLEDIMVKGGKVQIGFRASGIASAFCNVDDVSLVKTK